MDSSSHALDSSSHALDSLSHAGFRYQYYLFYQGNTCSVPQSKSPSLRILGLYRTDEEVMAALDRFRADSRVNRLPICIGRCLKRGILGLALSRAMHAYVVYDKVRDVVNASKLYDEEKRRAQLRKRDSSYLEYGVTYDYMNRVMNAQKDMRARYGKPAGWTAKQMFAYLLHNANAPDEGFDRSKMADRLRELLARRKEKAYEKRVWTVGEESAKSIEEIDWDATVAKQLEHMQADLESNLEKDESLQSALTSWPYDLRDESQSVVFVHFVHDMVEESLNWVDAMALGREPVYTVLGCCSSADEEFTSKYVRDSVVGQLDVPGHGILSFNMYEWFDTTTIFDSRIKMVYNDERMQSYYDSMVASNQMSRLIEDKAKERNAEIKTITTDDMIDQLRTAAERGDTTVPTLVTRVEMYGAQEEKRPE